MPQNSAPDSPSVAPRRSAHYGPKHRLKTVAQLDQRTRAAKRITALARTWAAALGDKLTNGQRIAIERAATLTALAEDARVRRLSGDLSISLEDIARLDNTANRAVRALGLPTERERESERDGPLTLDSVLVV